MTQADDILSMKPLFIPLKREYFNAFKNRTKDTEYRLYGPNWNSKTIIPGRKALLSLGYGKVERLNAVIIGFTTNSFPQEWPGWIECYGDKPGVGIAIKLDLATQKPHRPIWIP